MPKLQFILDAQESPFMELETRKTYRAAIVLEVVLVIAILIEIAILFNAEVREFAVSLFETVFGQNPAASILG